MRRGALVAALLIVLLMPPSGFGGHGGSRSPELTVVGHLNLAVGRGHISDVWAFGNFAYVGSFEEPECSLDFTGVHIVDISDPAVPRKVGFLPSPPGTRANDVKVAHLDTPFFKGEILVHSNEPCSNPFHPRVQSHGRAVIPGQGGIAIYDVTNPLNPRPLRQNFLPFPVHNTFIYQQGQNAYLLVVDDINQRDLHIVDITKPWDPRELVATGEPDWPALEKIPNGAVFLHDVWAQENNGRVIAYLAYWDAGLVLLDITDPARPRFLGDFRYPDPDRLSGEKPAGDSHVTVPTADGRYVIMGDEDFAPYALDFTFQGVPYPAAEGAFTKPIISLPNGVLTGPVFWTGGLGCTLASVPPAPTPDHIALIQRGECFFLTKGQNAQARGYKAFVVANRAGDDSLVTMVSPGGETADIPGLFVGFSTGEVIKAASPNGVLFARAFFDGWGYMRVLDVSNPANIVEVGRYATENVLRQPVPPGDHTMHNVIVEGRRAYISWYADGIRVVDFGNPRQPREIAHFVDRLFGSNFWGVYLHRHPNGRTYILGSDRDSGLWIFDRP